MTDVTYEDAARFVTWLERQVILAGRGDDSDYLTFDPDGLFWLGRLAPEEQVIALGLGDRGERLDPCAIGVRLKPTGTGPWSFSVDVAARCWLRHEDKADDTIKWRKSGPITQRIDVEVGGTLGSFDFGATPLVAALANVTEELGRSALIRVDVEHGVDGGLEFVVSLVNNTRLDDPPKRPQRDLNMYEVSFEISGLGTTPFELEALPDSFRYDRRVRAFGVNCGVEFIDDVIRSTDATVVIKDRPGYWNLLDTSEPDLSFAALSADPMPSLTSLSNALADWGQHEWGEDMMAQRARNEGWTEAMSADAARAAADFAAEVGRVRTGLALLIADEKLMSAFRLMNDALAHSANGRYDGWRPFQIGFVLANLPSIATGDRDAGSVDVVWFATGGGKTETYLGIVVMAALYDRLTGKTAGMTAWSRFPLRMLSLQQTQRFADAMAGAELARRKADLGGEPFSLGFFVGQAGTPNRINEEAKDNEPDPDDDEMPARFQVLLRCPFCHGDTIEMAFNRRIWALEHRCSADGCSSGGVLPFYVVDEEIYRFLPTVVIGTLDKAASISMQAAMRGFVASPLGQCSSAGHGFTYAKRSKRPNGCLVPGCKGESGPLPMPPERFAPGFRLQDELHLLRDSLGAVDAHYESLLDALQAETGGGQSKILASSATLAGFEKQVRVLYNREGRVFPTPPPRAGQGFWTADTGKMARRFVALAPRGVTNEFVVDRMTTVLQQAVRRLTDPDDAVVVAGEAQVSLESVPGLLSIYGVDVVYGNTLRDLDAVSRSLETQVPIEPLHVTQLTGRTEFEDVRRTLERLENPEDAFDDRIHVVTASSMMSHGVDIDRLNVMTVIGIPLTTAEFIQATARVGRRYPGLVFVLHKIARERDAGIFRSFTHFIEQGDRFVEPIPVTRRSRRVLERTTAGLQLARVLHVHEPRSKRTLTTVSALREYFRDAEIDVVAEAECLIDMLALDEEYDEKMRSDVEEWMDGFSQNLMDPAGTFRFPWELSPTGGPMMSLRDVEEQAPIRD